MGNGRMSGKSVVVDADAVEVGFYAVFSSLLFALGLGCFGGLARRDGYGDLPGNGYGYGIGCFWDWESGLGLQ